MNRDELLRLDRIATLKPTDIPDADKSVLDAIRETRSAGLASALREQMETSGPPELWKVAQGIDLGGEDPGAALLRGLAHLNAPPELISQATAQIDKVASLGLALDELPVGADPLVRDQVSAARMHRVAELASLDADTATALVEGGLRLTQVDDTQLEALVESKQLTDTQATAVGLATSLYRLLDEDTTLTEALLTGNARGLPDGGLSDIRDLVALDAADWQETLSAAAITAPGGMAPEQYALLLTKRFEAAFPTDAVLARLTTTDTKAVAGAIETATPALAQDADVLGIRNPDLSQIDGRSRSSVQKALGTLTDLIGTHQGLGLAEIVADTQATPKERAKAVADRVAAFETFRKQNPDVELVHLDYTPHSEDLQGLDFTGIAKREQPAMVRRAKVLQRTFAITEDAEDAVRLMAAGFDSAAALGSVPLAEVVERTGMPESIASRYHERAISTVGSSSLLVASMLDVNRGGFSFLGVDNTDPTIEDYFAEIDGYADLFGSQDYCTCEHCKSIVGPAAYFVDLMRFIDQHLLDPVFTGDLANHVLNLRTRRPDLWTLPLTCENTNTELPQLVIVNEILENYLATRTGFTGNLTNRAAVQQAVYRDQLAGSSASFRLPFNYPLARIRTYLAHFGPDRARILKALGAAADQRAAEELALSRAEFDLVVTPNTTQAFLNRVYAQTFNFNGSTVAPFDAQLLLRPMGITRDQLSALVGTGFVTGYGAEPVSIEGGRRSETSVQNDIERVTGLRTTSLDRLHRFTRLWRACAGWSAAELDLVLGTVIGPGLASGLDADALRRISDLRAIQRRLGVGVEELIGLVAQIPTRSLDGPGPGLFDRLFNLPELLALDGALPKPGTRFVLPALRDDPTAAATDHLLHRLLAATRTDAGTFNDLVLKLAGPLGADPTAAAEAERGFTLTVPHLTLLVRHARLAKMLKLPIADLFTLLGLLPGGALTHVGDAEDLRRLLDCLDWLRAAKLSIGRVAAILGAPAPATAALPDPDGVAQQAVNRVAAEAGSDPGALLRDAVAATLNLPGAKLDALLVLAGVDLDDPALIPEIGGNGSIVAISAAVGRVLAVAALFGAKEISATTVAFAQAHPDVFALTDPTALTAESLRLVSRFQSHLAGESAREADLVAVLQAHSARGGFAVADAEVLAALLEVEPGLVASLLANLTVPTGALDAVDALAAAAEIAGTIGVGGQALALLGSQDQDEQDQGADALFAAFRAKYTDEQAWQEAYAPFRATLLGAQRDALVDFLVYAIHPEFERTEDLFRYFLIDPEVEGCFTTSRVVAAISSAQMYVHRVLLNLERDRTGALNVRPSLVPREEWEWRQHYRMWEANRKVFLWPENYLFPDLRDDKTPLFENLEKELLQTDIDEQAVLDAYGTYLDGFQELAGLAIAGSYQEIDPVLGTDVLHLFGVTPGDPATFYYRRIENATPEGRRAGTVWGPWQKVDVAIGVREVSPVVHQGRLHLLWTEIVTAPVNEVADAGSRFVGYNHKFTVKFTTLRLDGRWTAPQRVRLYGTDPFGESEGVIEDPLAEPEEWGNFATAIANLFTWGLYGNSSSASSLNEATQRLITPRYDTQVHVKARDGYTLRTPEWTRLYPEVQGGSLLIAGAGYQMRAYLDTFDKATSSAPSLNIDRQAITWRFDPHSPLLTKRNGILYYGTPSFSLFDDYAFAALAADRTRLDRVLSSWTPSMRDYAAKNLYVAPLATLGSAQLNPINGSLSDGVIDAAGDLYLMQTPASTSSTWILRRLGTTLATRVARELFTHGVEHLLDINTQKALAEAPLAFSLSGSRVVNRVNSGKIDFTGPFGTYYREIFFHIPFLIANHLNSQGRYADAERWYHHIFDPTNSEVVPPNASMTQAQNDARRRDRNWRYLEFRGLTVPTLRQVLTDTSAIEAYHRDPFNPHAIARLRLSAYQKAIVMRYVDNKLDLADALFTQFQRESVNESLLHYATVAEILGDRPAQLGSCGDDGVEERTYEKIKPLLAKGSEFLVEAEHLVVVGTFTRTPRTRRFVLDTVSAAGITRAALGSERLKAAGVFSRAAAAKLDPQATRALFAAENAPATVAEQVRATASLPAIPASEPSLAPRLRRDSRPDAGTLFESRVVLPQATRTLRADLSRIRERLITTDIDRAAGLSQMGRTGPDDLNPEALRLKETERKDVLTAFDRSVGSVDAVSAVATVDPKRFLSVDRNATDTAVHAASDWKRLGAFEANNRLRPHLADEIKGRYRDKRIPGRFGFSVINQVNTVFCVPPNPDLLGYWDRLEDRLWKLRNCRDITGALRKLSLFAPEIDPMALVRARAAGLSLDEALTSLGGELPAYRFAYLLERAKSQASAVQGFGNALQSALERRDGEELNRLRAQHQQQILDLTTKAREQDVNITGNALAALTRHRETVQNRRDYFAGLVDGSLSAEEQAERISKHVANASRLTESTLGFLAGGLHLIPQLGSPFAMKYGGVEVGTSAHRFAVGVRAVGDFADALASSAAVEAGFNRREQGWKQQLQAAEDDLAEIDLQIVGATLRREVAEHALTVHQRAIDQAEEILGMYEEHFTGVGLYQYLATVLQRLHREAFNVALSMARMAERAFRFERDDDPAALSGSYWDAEVTGLTAGAQLLVDLQRLEHRYVETNQRSLEIDQSFSLSQVDPAALVQLRTTGQCEFVIPEVLFDIAYPGQYRRRLKSARITVPCVTGPYTNVSATLELTESWIRREPRLGAANIAQVPNAGTSAVATSTGQSDPGVFELNFRDERYLPFEGSGAVSAWRLSLPANFRQFDYGTINDVVLRLAYTALSDGAFRQSVEQEQAATEGTIVNVLATNGMPHVVSLRNEFSNAFNTVLHSPLGTDAHVVLTPAHLPFFLTGRDLTVDSAKLALRTRAGGPAPGALRISVDGTSSGAFTPDPALGGLPSADITGAFGNGFADTHLIRVTKAGGLAPQNPVAGDPSALDAQELLDLMLVLKLGIA